MGTSIQTTTSAGNDRLRQFFTGLPLRIAIIAIALLWTIPTIGLLITSFRPPDDIRSSGWWTVFRTPFEFTQYTLQNYEQVITADGMGNAFINSLLVTIPSVVIPITIAAFAAYAFAWLEFPLRRFF